MARPMVVRSSSLPDQVDATVSGTIDGKPVIYQVVLDLQIVPLGSGEDFAIPHSALADGYSVPKGGPYTVRYTYRGKQHETAGLWGDDNGQLVAVKP